MASMEEQEGSHTSGHPSALGPERTVRRVMDTWKELSRKKKWKLQCKYDFPSRENNSDRAACCLPRRMCGCPGLVSFCSPAPWCPPLLLVHRVTLQHPLGEPLLYPQGLDSLQDRVPSSTDSRRDLIISQPYLSQSPSHPI